MHTPSWATYTVLSFLETGLGVLRGVPQWTLYPPSGLSLLLPHFTDGEAQDKGNKITWPRSMS